MFPEIFQSLVSQPGPEFAIHEKDSGGGGGGLSLNILQQLNGFGSENF